MAFDSILHMSDIHEIEVSSSAYPVCMPVITFSWSFEYRNFTTQLMDMYLTAAISCEAIVCQLIMSHLCININFILPRVNE